MVEDFKIITARKMMDLTEHEPQAYQRLANAIGQTAAETRRLIEQGALDHNPIAVETFQSMMAEAGPEVIGG